MVYESDGVADCEDDECYGMGSCGWYARYLATSYAADSSLPRGWYDWTRCFGFR